MSNSETNDALIPKVVEVESSSPISTLVDRMSKESMDTSSGESVGTSAEDVSSP